MIHRMSALNRALLGTGTGFFSVDWLALGCFGDGPCSLETLTYVCLSTSSMIPSDRVFDLRRERCIITLTASITVPTSKR